MTTSELRANVQRVFSEGLGITFVPGKLEGRNETYGEWIGCCWLHTLKPDPSRLAELQVLALIRVYAPWSTAGLVSPNEPYDPTELEEMADRIMEVAASNHTGLGAWFQYITAIEIDVDDRGVQAAILAWRDNPAAAA